MIKQKLLTREKKKKERERQRLMEETRTFPSDVFFPDTYIIYQQDNLIVTVCKDYARWALPPLFKKQGH